MEQCFEGQPTNLGKYIDFSGHGAMTLGIRKEMDPFDLKVQGVKIESVEFVDEEAYHCCVLNNYLVLHQSAEVRVLIPPNNRFNVLQTNPGFHPEGIFCLQCNHFSYLITFSHECANGALRSLSLCFLAPFDPDLSSETPLEPWLEIFFKMEVMNVYTVGTVPSQFFLVQMRHCGQEGSRNDTLALLFPTLGTRNMVNPVDIGMRVIDMTPTTDNKVAWLFWYDCEVVQVQIYDVQSQARGHSIKIHAYCDPCLEYVDRFEQLLVCTGNQVYIYDVANMEFTLLRGITVSESCSISKFLVTQWIDENGKQVVQVFCHDFDFRVYAFPKAVLDQQ